MRLSAALHGCYTKLRDTYGPLYAASAMGANNLARDVLGRAFAMFTLYMYANLGVGWATSLLEIISLAMPPIAR